MLEIPKKYISFLCPSCGKWNSQKVTGYSDFLNDQQKLKLKDKLKLRCKMPHCKKTTSFKIKTGCGADYRFFDSPLSASAFSSKTFKATFQ